MPRLKVKRVMRSNMLKQTFIVHRKIGRWEAGRFIQDKEMHLPFIGVVENLNPKEVIPTPAGDKIAGQMAFYSNNAMYTTHAYEYPDTNASGTSDEIEWQGDRYRILTVNDYSDYGYYMALAVYMEGD